MSRITVRLNIPNRTGSMCIVLGKRTRKKGELLISHRYDRIPLLDSSPGGFCGSWSYKTHPRCKGNQFCVPYKFYRLFLFRLFRHEKEVE